MGLGPLIAATCPDALISVPANPIVGVVPPVLVIGAVAATLATAAPAVMPSSFVLSAAVIDPAAASVAAVIAMLGMAPPELVIGAVAVTATTPVADAACA